MYASTSFTSHLVLHDLLAESHTRRLLLENSPPPPPTHNATDLYLGDSTFDANVVMVLSVLLCAVIVSLGLNSIIRCALRCSDLVISGDPSSSVPANPSPRLANKGIKKKALKTFPILNYSTESKVAGLDTECIICLSDFASGEKVRVLPKCNHGFHVRCVDKWLSAHSSCPKCRQCLLHTCHKIVASQQPAQVVPLPETVITIEPLQPEGFVRNYN